jgi:hypothetical protein
MCNVKHKADARRPARRRRTHESRSGERRLGRRTGRSIPDRKLRRCANLLILTCAEGDENSGKAERRIPRGNDKQRRTATVKTVAVLVEAVGKGRLLERVLERQLYLTRRGQVGCDLSKRRRSRYRCSGSGVGRNVAYVESVRTELDVLLFIRTELLESRSIDIPETRCALGADMRCTKSVLLTVDGSIQLIPIGATGILTND